MILRKFVPVALLSISGLAGCYTTRIHTAYTPANVSLVASERWHHAIVGGVAELSDPVDLEGACPNAAPALIHEEVTFLNGVASGVTSGVYTPRTYTISCSASGGGGPGGSP